MNHVSIQFSPAQIYLYYSIIEFRDSKVNLKSELKYTNAPVGWNNAINYKLYNINL